jgi:hypothetical protein
MHPDIENCGLGTQLGITSEVDPSDPRHQFLNKRVRYKRELLAYPFLRTHGTIAIDGEFVIREVQNNFAGNPVLRGYGVKADGREWNDTFGRCFRIEEIEIMEDEDER